MPRNRVTVLIYHRHKLLENISSFFTPLIFDRYPGRGPFLARGPAWFGKRLQTDPSF
jgi:hypothetical protein